MKSSVCGVGVCVPASSTPPLVSSVTIHSCCEPSAPGWKSLWSSLDALRPKAKRTSEIKTAVSNPPVKEDRMIRLTCRNFTVANVSKTFAKGKALFRNCGLTTGATGGIDTL